MVFTSVRCQCFYKQNAPMGQSRRDDLFVGNANNQTKSPVRAACLLS